MTSLPKMSGRAKERNWLVSFLKKNGLFFLVVLSITLGYGGGTAIYPPTSETITTWRTMTSRTTYISTFTSLRASSVKTTSTATSTYTLLEDSIQTFANYSADIREERAAHYAVRALVIEITLPPEIIPTGKDTAQMLMEYHYRSPKSMVLERIGLGTWMDMKTSSETWYMYWPTEVNVSEGIGSLFDFEYIDRNDTEVATVYISKEGVFPEILSVDLKRVWKDAVTENRTALKTTTFWSRITYTETIEETYTKTMTYKTYETYVLTPSPITTVTKETFTMPPTSTTTIKTYTLTPTTTRSPISGIDMLGFQILIFAILAAAVGLALGLIIRRSKKSRAAYGPLPPPI